MNASTPLRWVAINPNEKAHSSEAPSSEAMPLVEDFERIVARLPLAVVFAHGQHACG